MLKKTLRLRHPSDFARLRQEGQAFHHRWMIVSVAENHLPHNRYGFIASRAVGNAVVRNRQRRQLREAIRQLHPRLKSGFDIVVVAKKPMVGQPFNEILQTLARLTGQSGCLSE